MTSRRSSPRIALAIARRRDTYAALLDVARVKGRIAGWVGDEAFERLEAEVEREYLPPWENAGRWREVELELIGAGARLEAGS